MLFIYGKSIVKPENIEEFLKLNEEFVCETQKEEGCVSFYIGKVHGTDNIYAYIECFRDQAALDFHHKTNHFLRLAGPIKALLEAPIDVVFHDIVE